MQKLTSIMWSKILKKQQLYPDATIRMVNDLNKDIYMLQYRLIKWNENEATLEPLSLNDNLLREDMRVRFTIALSDLLKGTYQIQTN